MMVKVFDMSEDGESVGESPLFAMVYRLDSFGKLVERQIVSTNFREQASDGKPIMKLSRGPKEMRYTLCDEHRHYSFIELADGILRHATLVRSKLCDGWHSTFHEGVDTEVHISKHANSIFKQERHKYRFERARKSIADFLWSLTHGHNY